jgi:hypothetical protein
MYSIEALNAARRSHNRAEEEVVGEATGHELAHWFGRKFFGGGMALWLGFLQGYTGEPSFGSGGDPTKGVGLKAAVALFFNGVELVQLIGGYHFGKYGAIGATFDGAIEGFADAGWFTWLFDFGNTSGSAKRAKEKQAAAAGFEYERRRREQLNPPKPQINQVRAQTMGTRVAAAQHAAMADPFNGYR